MSNWFDDLTKTLADEKLTRRRVIFGAMGIIAGATFATVMPRSLVSAKPEARARKYASGSCPSVGSCAGGNFNCVGNPNANCYCFQDMSGSAVCGCNTNCSGIVACSTDTDCGAGYACVTNTMCSCNSGVCVPLCTGPHAKCQLHA